MNIIYPRRLVVQGCTEESTMIPVRCFSCGSLIATKNTKFHEMLNNGCEESQALDEAGVKRTCCRRMLVSQPTGFRSK